MIKKDIIKIYGERLKELGVNLNVLTKDDLLAILNFRCEHKHSVFTHPNCFRKSNSRGLEKVACLDLETSNLHANFGMILSWAIKFIDGKYFKDVVQEGDEFDYRIVKTCIDVLKKADRVVGHYSTYFDIPFLRTRALYWNIDFPEYGSIYHTDVWKIARRKLRLHSNRQGSVAEAVLHQNIKTRIHPQIWLDIQFGSKAKKEKAINYIVDHNIKDVKQLESNYLKLRKFVREGRNSI